MKLTIGTMSFTYSALVLVYLQIGSVHRSVWHYHESQTFVIAAEEGKKERKNESKKERKNERKNERFDI